MDELIAEINELSKKAKTVGLTEDEMEKRQILRAEYIRRFRESMTGILDNTYIQRPDGSREKLKKKSED